MLPFKIIRKPRKEFKARLANLSIRLIRKKIKVKTMTPIDTNARATHACKGSLFILKIK